MIQIKEINFNDIDTKRFGIVVTGAGGELTDWIKGLSEELVKEKLVETTSDNVFAEAYRITGNNLGEEGRVDMLLFFNKDIKLNIGRLAMWRLSRSNIKWHDDFLVNYKNDYV